MGVVGYGRRDLNASRVGLGYLAQKMQQGGSGQWRGPKRDGSHPPTPIPHSPQSSSPPTVQRGRSLGGSLPPPVDGARTPVRAQGRIAMLGLCQREPPPTSGWGCSQLAPLALHGRGEVLAPGPFLQPDHPRITLELMVAARLPRGYCPKATQPSS